MKWIIAVTLILIFILTVRLRYLAVRDFLKKGGKYCA